MFRARQISRGGPVQSRLPTGALRLEGGDRCRLSQIQVLAHYTSPAKDDAFLDQHQKQLRSKRKCCDWSGQKNQEDLFVELEYLFGFRPGTGITVRLVRSYLQIQATHLEDQEWMCHRVVPVIFPVLQRIKDTNCRARLIPGTETDGGPDKDGYMPFASKWNPTSIEAITTDFWEVSIRSSLRIVVQ
jgi:hypothetical protein